MSFSTTYIVDLCLVGFHHIVRLFNPTVRLAKCRPQLRPESPEAKPEMQRGLRPIPTEFFLARLTYVTCRPTLKPFAWRSCKSIARNGKQDTVVGVKTEGKLGESWDDNYSAPPSSWARYPMPSFISRAWINDYLRIHHVEKNGFGFIEPEDERLNVSFLNIL